MMRAEKIEKNVWVTLIGITESVWGKVYLSANERLQDLVNDDRKFIPIYVDSDATGRNQGKLQLINKNSISVIREI